jgi:hypothetical protein
MNFTNGSRPSGNKPKTFRRLLGTSYPYLPKVTKIKSRLDMIFSRFPSVNELFIFSQQSLIRNLLYGDHDLPDL